MWGMLPTFFYSGRFPRPHVKDALEDVVVAELDALGFDLVELRRGGTRSRPLIEVRIDRRDGSRVSVDDCARASRAIEARLDRGRDGQDGSVTHEGSRTDDGENGLGSIGRQLVAPQYVLQVSSPGERPL